MRCISCGKEISSVAEVCPYCHRSTEDSLKVRAPLTIGMFLGAVLGYYNGGVIEIFLGTIIGGLIGLPVSLVLWGKHRGKYKNSAVEVRVVADPGPSPAIEQDPPIKSTPISTESIISSIERLAALKSAGMLTDEEFLAEKQSVLVRSRSTTQVADEALARSQAHSTPPAEDATVDRRRVAPYELDESLLAQALAPKEGLLPRRINILLICIAIGVGALYVGMPSFRALFTGKKLEAPATTPTTDQSLMPTPLQSTEPPTQTPPPKVGRFGTISRFEESQFARTRLRQDGPWIDKTKNGLRWSVINLQASGVSGASISMRDLDGSILGFGLSFNNDRGYAVPLPWNKHMGALAEETIAAFVTVAEARQVVAYVKENRLVSHPEGVGNGSLTKIGQLWVAAGTTGGDLIFWVAESDNPGSSVAPRTDPDSSMPSLHLGDRLVQVGDRSDVVIAALKEAELAPQNALPDPALPGSLLLVRFYEIGGAKYALTFRRRTMDGPYLLTYIEPR